MKGTGSRGVQIFPRSKKYTDKYDSIFRPESGSKTKSPDLKDKDEKKLDRTGGSRGV